MSNFESNSEPTSKPSNILVLMSGSIAAYKVCDLISQLVQRGHRVRVAMTRSAQRFVTPTTIEGLCGAAPLTDLFESDRAMQHIEWAKWADVAILTPATAATLNRVAHGIPESSEDAVGALVLALPRSTPFLIAPAMNTQMWSHPTVEASLVRLGTWAQVLGTGSGRLACGDVGPGRLLEPTLLLEAIERATQEARATRLTHTNAKRILITAGGTQEPLDAVRFIGNRSTGRTGSTLADTWSRQGHHVTLLRAQSAIPAQNTSVQTQTFVTTDDLQARLKEALETTDFDLVVHLAAVSDYRPDHPESGKHASDLPSWTLTLKKTPKLIHSIREVAQARWGHAPKVFGFKLTHGAEDDTAVSEDRRTQAVEPLLKYADAVIQNDAEVMHRPDRVFRVYAPQSKRPVHSVQSIDALATHVLTQTAQWEETQNVTHA